MTGQPFSLTTRNGRRPSRESREALAEKLEERISQGAPVSENASGQNTCRERFRESTEVSFEVEDIQEDQELKEGLHEMMKTAKKASEYMESGRPNGKDDSQMNLEDGEIDDEGAFESMADIEDRRPSWSNISYSDRTRRHQWRIDLE